MRKILFRGKLESGAWVYGDLRQYPSGNVAIRSDEWGHTLRVGAETVGQYTGLADKNGTKIFEGDVVRLEDGETGVIVFRDAGFALSNGGCSFCVSSQCERLVLGNIHDNPELMR